MSRPTIEFKEIPFEAGHAEDLIGQAKLNEAEKKFLLDRHLYSIAADGHGVSFVANGHLLGAGGIIPIWDGLGEAWVLPGNLIHRHRKTFVRLVRDGIDRMNAEHQFRRIQATARADAASAQRFLEFLGFEREGCLRAYGPDGADHFLFAKMTGG